MFESFLDGVFPPGKIFFLLLPTLSLEFLGKIKDPSARQVHVHTVCAIDTDSVSRVMDSVVYPQAKAARDRGR